MNLNPLVIFIVFAAYTVLLFVIAHFTSRKSNNDSFFKGNRKSPWFVVAYGMIGASLSGVTFMSVPGGVYTGHFTYIGIVLGYVIGYVVIAFVLLPLYYKLNLTSIYSYLESRFGVHSERTGAAFFLISRLLGSALRMYLVVFVLYNYVFEKWGIHSFALPAVIFIVIILLYTFKGGIKTVVWTDMLQTTFLILAAVLTVVAITKDLNMGIGEILREMTNPDDPEKNYTMLFEYHWSKDNFWLKQVLSGAFITITMTGLDQDMMQKNLTCKNLRDAQKNVLTSSGLFIVVNIVFLCLGAALIYYSQVKGLLPDNPQDVVNDKIFSEVAFHLSPYTALLFVLGLVAAGYSSADGTLTALTTTFCYDFLHFERKNYSENQVAKYRKLIHVGFALLYLLVIVCFKPFHNDSLINKVFEIAGYTYGPLLGLFTFGLFVKNRKVYDKAVPFIAVASPVICYLLKYLSVVQEWSYQFGFEILILNGLLTFIGLLAFSHRQPSSLILNSKF